MELTLIQHKIQDIRGQKVILDFDLAAMYETETRTLKQAVRRNIARFPDDFMFQLTKKEIKSLLDMGVSQTVIPSNYNFGSTSPFAFTEQGVAMLSSVLKSDQAVQVNIAIIRAFVAIRNFALNYQELASRMKDIESQFPEIYSTLSYLMTKDKITLDTSERVRIGFERREK